ncbi:MAG: hypothetical protein HYR66_10960 [Sphingobacteriales bacterium]|nr:hypothetical protein [Sphingobacteriales bacterium]MBI3720346.1 hypothetical protein [Sphingobacteriales bacterium]
MLLLLMKAAAFSQGKYPVAKAYAYSQKEISGINRKVMDKDGKIIRGKNTSTHYHLYLECYAGKEIVVDNVWINGQTYKVDVKKTESPVTVSSGIKGVKTNQSETLVPQTSNNVMAILPGDVDEVKVDKKISKLIKNNAVLFAYSFNGKKYYLAVNSLKEITPEVNQ